jgi:hypothetical protein
MGTMKEGGGSVSRVNHTILIHFSSFNSTTTYLYVIIFETSYVGECDSYYVDIYDRGGSQSQK